MQNYCTQLLCSSMLDRSLTTSFLPFSPPLSILCFYSSSVTCMFAHPSCHAHCTFLSFFLSHCPFLHPSLPTDYRQPSHAVHLFCIRRRSSESHLISRYIFLLFFLSLLGMFISGRRSSLLISLIKNVSVVDLIICSTNLFSN